MKADNFTTIPQTWDNIDMYVIRTCIWNAIKKCAPQFKGHMLDVGCGKKPYMEFLLKGSYISQYTGLDIETALVYEDGIKPDFTWDGETMPFADNSFDTLMATEVLEHCSDPLLIIKEMKRVLKPDGILFFTVPFLWNLHEVPHDHYRYTPFALQKLFNESGLQVELYAHGGWNMSMAQMIGMWVVATKKGAKRKRWSWLLNPFMKHLLKIDAKEQPITFSDGMMINGMYGVARKENKLT